MQVISRISEPPMVFSNFGHAANHHDVSLMELGCRATWRDEDSTGPAQVAFKIGSSVEELALVRKRLRGSRTPVLNEAERGFATGVHVLDPDGNEIELARSGTSRRSSALARTATVPDGRPAWVTRAGATPGTPISPKDVVVATGATRADHVSAADADRRHGRRADRSAADRRPRVGGHGFRAPGHPRRALGPPRPRPPQPRDRRPVVRGGRASGAPVRRVPGPDRSRSPSA